MVNRIVNEIETGSAARKSSIKRVHIPNPRPLQICQSTSPSELVLAAACSLPIPIGSRDENIFMVIRGHVGLS